jgi:hypothetical protein
MRGCLRFLALMVAFLFIVSTALAFLMFNLARVTRDRDAVKQAIDGERLLRDTLLQLANDAVQQQAQATGLPPIDQDVLRRSITQIVPPGWVGVQTNAAVDALFDYLEDETMSSPELVIHIAPFMASLRGEPGRQAIQTVAQSLPVCAGPQFYPSLRIDRFEIPLCIPPEINVSLMTAQIHNVLNFVLDAYPVLVGEDTIRWRFLDEALVSPDIRSGFEQFRWLYRLSQDWAWLLWLIPLACLFLLLLLDVRSLATFGHWWGWSMLIAGLFTIVLTFLFPYWLNATFRSQDLLPQLGVAGIAISRFLQTVLHALMGQWLRGVSLQAAVLLIIGAFFIMLGFIGNALSYSRRRQVDHYWDQDGFWEPE